MDPVFRVLCARLGPFAVGAGLAGCPAPVTGPPVADAGPDRAVPVGVPLSLVADGDPSWSYTWDLGDGRAVDGQAVTVSWEAPGNLGIVLTVVDVAGRRWTDAARVTVYRPPAEVPPVASASLALDPARGVFWSAIPETDALVRVPVSGGPPEEVVPCGGIRTVAVDGETVWATCEADDTLVAVEGDRIRWWDLGTGRRPHGVVARGGTAWVSLWGTGEVAVVRGDDVEIVAVGPDPRAIAVDPAGQVLAARFRSADAGGTVYADVPWTLARQEGTDSDTKNRGVPNLLDGLAVSPDGGTVAVAGQVSNDVRGLWRDGQPLTFETTVRGILRGFDAGTGAPIPALDRQFDNQGHAGPIAFSPLGNWLYVAHPGTGTVAVLDAYTGGPVAILVDAGIGLTAVVPSPDGRWLYTHAALDREIRVFDLEALVGVPAPVDALPCVVTEPLDPDVLLGKRIFANAGDLRVGRDGYLACTSCHPDGGDDGRTWDFTDRGEGLRNTTTLEGRAGTGMGPVHWTGNFDEIQDFEHDMRHGGAGLGFLTPEQWASGTTNTPLGDPKAGLSVELDALAAYVASLDTTPPSPYPADPVGEALFSDIGCDGCHPPPAFTDSDLDTFLCHDVGTATDASGQRLSEILDGFDTPTLLGTWATPPYLHDGSAPTLQDAILAHDPAVLTRPPTAAEVEHLAAYVRSL